MAAAAVALPLMVKWGPVLLKCLMKIIEYGKDLYALWREMQSSDQDKNSVTAAMKLLEKFKNNTDELIKNPQLKEVLLKGLTLLVTGISHRRVKGKMAQQASPGRVLIEKSSEKRATWKECNVCFCSINLTDRGPTILICGHTFCRLCLEDMCARGPLLCPLCRMPDKRPFAALPLNTKLISVLEEAEKNDDVCRTNDGGGGKGDECDVVNWTFEQQIEYAIQLSQQETQSRGATYVEESWREVLEAEEEMMARAIHESEVLAAAQLCEQPNVKASTGDLHPHEKKVDWEEYGACGGAPREPLSPGSRGEDDEASLNFALELHQQELANIQRQGTCSNSDGTKCGVVIGCGPGGMKEHQHILGIVLCRAVANTGCNNEQERRQEKSKAGKENEDRDEDHDAGCCNPGQEKKRKAGSQDDCERKYTEDDCHKGGRKHYREEFSAFLANEEERHLQMAIHASMMKKEDGEACGGDQTDPASPGCQGEDDEASLLLAIQLQQQEVADMQRQHTSSTGTCCGAASSGGARWMKINQHILGTALCALVERAREKEQKMREEEKDNKKREQQKDADHKAGCCSSSQEEEIMESTQEDGRDRNSKEDDYIVNLVEWEKTGAKQKPNKNQTKPASPRCCGEDDKASLILALQLQQQEVADIQRRCSSSSSTGSSCGAGWMKAHQLIPVTALCGSVEKDVKKEQEMETDKTKGDEKADEQKGKEHGSTLCNISQEEEREGSTQGYDRERRDKDDSRRKEGSSAAASVQPR